MARLTRGQVAPDFQALDYLGQPVNLADLKGRKLMLSFYRYASCPLCNLRMRELIRHFTQLDPSIALVAVFQSPAESIIEYVARQDAPFPIVADPQRILYERYGLESRWSAFFRIMLTTPWKPLQAFINGFLPGRVEGHFHAVPADFLIDENGIIQQAYYGRDIGDHLPLESVLRFAAAPQPSEVDICVG